MPATPRRITALERDGAQLLCPIVQPLADTAERLPAFPGQAHATMRVAASLTADIVVADRGGCEVPGLNDSAGCPLRPSSVGHF